MKTWWCVTSSFDDRGHVTAGITDTKKQDEQPESTVFSTPRKDIYCDWFCSIEEARSYVHEALRENLYAYSAMI